MLLTLTIEVQRRKHNIALVWVLTLCTSTIQHLLLSSSSRSRSSLLWRLSQTGIQIHIQIDLPSFGEPFRSPLLLT